MKYETMTKAQQNKVLSYLRSLVDISNWYEESIENLKGGLAISGVNISEIGYCSKLGVYFKGEFEGHEVCVTNKGQVKCKNKSIKLVVNEIVDSFNSEMKDLYKNLTSEKYLLNVIKDQNLDFDPVTLTLGKQNFNKNEIN